MRAASLLHEVKSRGMEIRLVGDHLRLSPKRRLPTDLLKELQENKSDLIRLLKEPGDVSVRQSLPGGVLETNPSVSVEEVCAMTLVEFSEARLKVEVYSQVLDEAVIFASDNARLDPRERRVVYRARELIKLAEISPTPAELRSVHLAKKEFGGTISDN